MLFSVIIPAYNVEQYIPEALDSLLAQTYSEWEAIVVDDGSTDATGEIADGYARKDSRFKVIHQANQGVAAARNRALDECQGDYFCFLDADDFLHTDCLNYCKKAFLENTQSNLVCYQHVFSAKPSFLEDTNNYEVKLLDCTNFIPEKIWKCGLWTVCYRRKSFEEVRFEPYIYAEDVLFFTQCLLKSSNVAFIDATLYAYRERPGSAMCSAMTMRKTSDSFQANVKILHGLLSSGKSIPRKKYRRLLRSVFEMPFVRYFDLNPNERCPNFLDTWKDKIQDITKTFHLPIWYVARYRIISFFRFYFLSYLLMAFPLACIIRLTKIRSKILCK